MKHHRPAPHTTVVFALSFLAACGAAHAQGSERYLLISVGNASYTGNAQADTDAFLAGSGQTGISSGMGTTSKGYKAMLGYPLAPAWAVEGGFVDLGTYGYNASASGGGLKADFKGSGLNISGLGLVPVNSELSVFGKLGLTYSMTKGSGSGTGISLGTTDEKIRLGYGVGGLYHLTGKLGLRAEWERLSSDINLFSIGLQARF
jgi:OOP family OmpA-OmpF porin